MTEEEFRRDAIKRYLKGEHPKSIYEGMGRSKAWFFKWLKRYQTGDSHGYKSLSKAPRQTPRKLREAVRQRIIDIREQLQRKPFTQIGVTAIKWELHKAGVSIPSDRTIHRVLKQEGLVKKNFLRCKGC